jgi:hypothetical protein
LAGLRGSRSGTVAEPAEPQNQGSGSSSSFPLSCEGAGAGFYVATAMYVQCLPAEAEAFRSRTKRAIIYPSLYYTYAIQKLQSDWLTRAPRRGSEQGAKALNCMRCVGCLVRRCHAPRPIGGFCHQTLTRRRPGHILIVISSGGSGTKL